MWLTREVRFQVTGADGMRGAVLNSWGGWPAHGGLAPYAVVRLTVEGQPESKTGYLCNISAIDELIRERGVPVVNQLWASEGRIQPPGGAAVVLALWEAIRDHAPEGTYWRRLNCRVTPYLSYEVRSEDWAMVRTTQRFEFAASHRLYRAEFSETKNREVFGKCSNPNGHGHNYLVDVTVAGDPDEGSLGVLERVVKTEIVDRFDHKHLNLDCAEFATLNPTVENITRVIWDRLEGKFGQSRLVRVRVWETPKTYAEYFGGNGEING